MGRVKDLVPKMQVDRYKIHDIELVVDRLQVTDELKARLSQSVQQTLKLGKDLMFLLVEKNSDNTPRNNGKTGPVNKKASQPAAPKISFAEEDSKTSSSVIQYSKLLMCEDGISYEEPSPNAFFL